MILGIFSGAVSLIVAILMLKYLEGDFSIQSVEKIDWGTIEGAMYVDLKITYRSGRVKYKTQIL